MQQLVVNADDFGASSTINAAVISAFRYRSLRSTSLMVTGDAVEEAVDLAHRHPGLAVGLHLVVAGGNPCSPPERIPHLVDREGRLPARPARLGLAIALRPAARSELRVEVAAQFERFAATGLSLSHVDGHLHMHLHPFILPAVVDLAARFGARAIRVPRDVLGASLHHHRRRLLTKLWWWMAFGLVNRMARRQIEGSGLTLVDRVYGLMQSGQMDEDYVLSVLRLSPARTAEIYFHPDSILPGVPLGPNPGDLATLLSPTVRDAIHRSGGPAVFAELATAGEA